MRPLLLVLLLVQISCPQRYAGAAQVAGTISDQRGSRQSAAESGPSSQESERRDLVTRYLHSWRQGDLEAAESSLRRLIELEGVLLGPESDRVSWRWRQLTEVLLEQQQLEEAQAAAERALEIVVTAHSEDDWRVEDTQRFIEYVVAIQTLPASQRQEFLQSARQMMLAQRANEWSVALEAAQARTEVLIELLGDRHLTALAELIKVQTILVILNQADTVPTQLDRLDQLIPQVSRTPNATYANLAVAGAGLAERSGDLDVANRRYQRALTLYDRSGLSFLPEVAITHNNFAILLSRQGRMAESVDHYRQAERLWSKNLDVTEPGFDTIQTNLVRVLLDRGEAAIVEHDWSTAEDLLTEASNLADSAWGTQSPQAREAKIARDRLEVVRGMSEENLNTFDRFNEIADRWQAAYNRNDGSSAVELSRKRLELAIDLFGPDSFDALRCDLHLHQQIPWEEGTAARYAAFADRVKGFVGDQHQMYAYTIIVQAGRTNPTDEAAVDLAKEAVAIFRQQEGFASQNLAESLSTLGHMQFTISAPDVESTLLEALQHWQNLGGQPNHYLIVVLTDLSSIAEFRGRNEAALAYITQAIQSANAIGGFDTANLAGKLIKQGDLYFDLGNPTEAVKSFQRAGQMTSGVEQHRHLYRDALLSAGSTHYIYDDYDAAVDVLTKLVDDYGPTLDADDPLCVDGVGYLAASLRLLERYDESLKILSRLDASVEEAGGTVTEAQFAIALQRIAIARDQDDLETAQSELANLGQKVQAVKKTESQLDDDVWLDWLIEIRDRAYELDMEELSLWARKALAARARRVYLDQDWRIADAARDAHDYQVRIQLSESERQELAKTDVLWEEVLNDDSTEKLVSSQMITQLEQALATRERLLGPDHADVVDNSNGLSLHTLSDRLRSWGQAQSAHEMRMEIVERLSDVLGPKHPQTGRAKVRAAVTAREENQIEEGHQLLLDGLATLRENFGADSTVLASPYHELAVHHLSLHQFASALPPAREAVDRYQAGSEAQSLEHAVALRTLYQIYDALGMKQEAFNALLASTGIITQLFDSSDEVYLDAVLEGAVLMGQADDFREQVDVLFKQLLAGYEALGSRHWGNYGRALAAFGDFCDRQGKYERARELYQRSLEVREKFYDQPNHPLIAQSHAKIGEASLQLADLDAALQHLEHAYQMQRDVVGAQSSEVVVSLFHLAVVKLLQGQAAAGYPLLVKSLTIEQAAMKGNFLLGSDQAIADVLDGNDDKHAWLLSVHLAGNAPPNQLDSALAWTLNRKGLALDAASRLQSVQRHAAHDPATLQMLEELQGLRRSLAAGAVTNRQDETLGPYGSRTLTTGRIDDLEEQLALKLQDRVGDFVSLHVDVIQLRQRIPTNGALVEYVVTPLGDFGDHSGTLGEEHIIAFWVPHPDDGAIHLVDLGPYEPIEADILALREHIERTPRSLRLSSESGLEEQFVEISGRLSQTLLEPFKQEIAGLEHLLVAPDGALHGLPFAALPGPSAEYLIEDVTISYLSSGRDLLREHEAVGRGSVVIADPDFDATGDEAVSQPSTRADEPLLALRGVAEDDAGDIALRSLLWRPLPGARQEAQDIQQLLEMTAYDPIQVYTGRAAAEGVVRAAVSPRLIHLATHGFFVPFEPPPEGESLTPTSGGTGLSRLRMIENPLLRSGLVLAGANRSADQIDADEDTDDGWLTAEEIASLDLRNTELVVLSACESGLGKATFGHGVRGLQRAFLVAGAHGLMTALFEIPDIETRELVHAFYKEFTKGRPRAEALQQAQRTTIAARREKHGAAHPFYWASFTMLGRPESNN